MALLRQNLPYLFYHICLQSTNDSGPLTAPLHTPNRPVNGLDGNGRPVYNGLTGDPLDWGMDPANGREHAWFFLVFANRNLGVAPSPAWIS